MHYRPLSHLRTAAVRGIPFVRLTEPLTGPSGQSTGQPTGQFTAQPQGHFTGQFTGQGPQFAELTGAYWLDSYGHGGDAPCECASPAAETGPGQLPPTTARARTLRTVPSPTHRSM